MPINTVDASEVARENEVLDEIAAKLFTAQYLVATNKITTADQFLEAILGIDKLLYSIHVEKLDQIGFGKIGHLGISEWKSLLTMTRDFRKESPACEQQMRLIEGQLTDLLSESVRMLVKQNDPSVSNIVLETRLNLVNVQDLEVRASPTS